MTEPLQCQSPFPVIRVIFQRRCAGVYLYRREFIDNSAYGGDGLEMANAYDLKSGVWIGDAKTARRLVRKYGIREFYKRKESSTIATIGFAPGKNLWYGWSHRAIHGFQTRAKAGKFAKSVS